MSKVIFNLNMLGWSVEEHILSNCYTTLVVSGNRHFRPRITQFLQKMPHLDDLTSSKRSSTILNFCGGKSNNQLVLIDPRNNFGFDEKCITCGRVLRIEITPSIGITPSIQGDGRTWITYYIPQPKSRGISKVTKISKSLS